VSGATRLVGRGKVRDLYDVGEQRLLLVASDRVSAFDVVLPTPIPDKGRVLTGLSAFWIGRLGDVVSSHLVSADARDFPEPFGSDPDLRGRAMLVRRADVIPVECVARGYLSGSGWRQYRETGAVCGVVLPPGLVESAPLPEPVFTPTTKASHGHDVPLTPPEAEELLGRGLMERLKELTLSIYERGASLALDRGIIVADTKLEFGFVDGEITLIDEVLTPDSSRFWPVAGYRPGGAQPSFDKQYVRDWLDGAGWDHEPPGPQLPPEVVEQTSRRYREAYDRITGTSFAEYIRRAVSAEPGSASERIDADRAGPERR
jgi:phosphoribosylaminoimidazole-succinocarboxamide synthase